MATIPEKPQTNLEQYLNRIATGDGEYPAEPHTNVEQYLNYIIEEGVGGGGELVTELPPKGKDGSLYVLVDDAEHPTKAYGVYSYAGGNYVLVAQTVDQSIQIVSALPQEGQEGVLYYLEKSGQDDTYDMYRWVNSSWVKVDTDVKLYSVTGQNTDGPMTQKATTDMIYDSGNAVVIGSGAASSSGRNDNVAIGTNAKTKAYVGVSVGAYSSAENYGTAVGYGAKAFVNSIAIGHNSDNNSKTSSIALGVGAKNTRYNELAISYYNGATTTTRFIAGVKDPELATDAATKNYVDTNMPTLLTNSQFNNILENA